MVSLSFLIAYHSPSQFMPFVKLRLHPKRSWPLAGKISIYVCLQRSLPLSLGLHVSGIKLAAWNQAHYFFATYFSTFLFLWLFTFIFSHSVKECTWKMILVNPYSNTYKQSIDHDIVHDSTFCPFPPDDITALDRKVYAKSRRTTIHLGRYVYTQIQKIEPW